MCACVARCLVSQALDGSQSSTAVPCALSPFHNPLSPLSSLEAPTLRCVRSLFTSLLHTCSCVFIFPLLSEGWLDCSLAWHSFRVQLSTHHPLEYGPRHRYTFKLAQTNPQAWQWSVKCHDVIPCFCVAVLCQVAMLCICRHGISDRKRAHDAMRPVDRLSILGQPREGAHASWFAYCVRCLSSLSSSAFCSQHPPIYQTCALLFCRNYSGTAQCVSS